MTSAADRLASVGAGFADPTHGAQRAFRTLLDAMSRPGCLCPLPREATAGLALADRAPPVGPGMAALLLTLLDADTPVRLAGCLDDAQTWAWIRFHTSARRAASAGAASFVAGLAAGLTPAVWEALALGSDDAPQDGATLILEVDAFGAVAASSEHEAMALTLRGPGIATKQSLVVRGVPEAFWDWRQALEAARPRGVDLVLVQGTTVAAIPRSTRIEPGH